MLNYCDFDGRDVLPRKGEKSNQQFVYTILSVMRVIQYNCDKIVTKEITEIVSDLQA